MTNEELAKLPTLLDVIDELFASEHSMELHKQNSEFNGLFPTHMQKGYFQPFKMNDGKDILLPLTPVDFTYYRGESSFHGKCFPSLLREGMGDAEIFIERIKRCELELMMKDYPITDIVERGIYAKTPDNSDYLFHFRIGYDGLAQHYGIKTEYLDLTVDLWTAAFFAATTYDKTSDTYSPILDTKDYQYGAFYVYMDLGGACQDLCGNAPRIDVVGLQPLARPGRQAGFVYRMEKEENFNKIARKRLFRHDARVNELIFNYANRGNRLFPKEILNRKIRKGIVEAHSFSRWSYEEARKRYYPDEKEKVLVDYLKQKGINISQDNKRWFTEEEKQEIVKYWEDHKEEFLSKIIPRWTFQGEVKEITDVEEFLKL